MSALKGSLNLVADARNQTGSASVTVDSAQAGATIPAGTVRAFASLVNVNHADQQASFAADCFISSYNQGGKTHKVFQRHLLGDNITEVAVTLNVNGCEALGVCVIDVF